MTAWEGRATEIKDDLVAGLAEFQRGTARSRQQADNVIGVSDIGTCREKLRRMLAQETADRQGSMWPAFIGTAIGDHIESALAAARGWDTQLTVDVELPSGYRVSGHPDIVTGDTVIDTKTVNGLAVVRRSGPTTQQRFQVHLYAHGLNQAGRDIEWVAIAYWDRSGQEDTPYVWTEPFSEAVVAEADEFIGDAVYALRNGEEAMKEPPRDWCAAACGFYQACRADDTDVAGLIEDPVVVAAVDVYAEAQAAIKAAEINKKAAVASLAGIAGFTKDFSIRWITVGESDVPAHIRAGYERIDIRRRKK